MAGSNVAEYLALIEGLEALGDMHIAHEAVEVRGDAKCVIDQMRGFASVSAPLTRKLYRRAKKMARGFKALTWVWVPRRENKSADRLSRRSFSYPRCFTDLEREISALPRIKGDEVWLAPLMDLRIHASRV